MTNNREKWDLACATYCVSHKKGQYKKYLSTFPDAYTASHKPEQVLRDIEKILTLIHVNAGERIAIDMARKDSSGGIRLQIYHAGNPIPLSQSLPVLENLGMYVITEHPYILSIRPKEPIWIHDFYITLSHAKEIVSFDTLKMKFEEAFLDIMQGRAENDGLNRLVPCAHMSIREVILLRSYTHYLLQTGFRFSKTFIHNTLQNHSMLVRGIIDLFYAKFRLHHKQKARLEQSHIKETLVQYLEQVSSLDEDVVLRSFISLVDATLRTNYFQKNNLHAPKSYISLKFDGKAIPDTHTDKAMFEIFVYAYDFEGVHLRYDTVARGGIRYSDRPEDFRTEIMGLMRAQVIKNALIVPSGAKGGFIVKDLPINSERAVIQKKVIACYQSFIRALLDITDNIRDGKIIPPGNCVCYDTPDPYLVVAADKGTASFSDIANHIAHEYTFWLGDAFASGGSAGYDHKKMGITARGAWESIKRGFLELGINHTRDYFSMAGIGDMSGDVFGNGLLYSPNIALIAAFDHRHIFIDPAPQPERAWQERKRLFSLARSSWEDYDKTLISEGGGVFPRTAKSIVITEPMKNILHIHDERLTPNDLILAILKAPVDILYNGGIGTYVKAGSESHADAKDKANDYTRVDADALRCKIIAEGGNLGVTKLARIEYALSGGIISGDFIDNAGGVNCSDNEVNIKILLNKMVASGNLSEKKRNILLRKMEAEVAHIVLRDNYKQALLLSMSVLHAAKYAGLYRNYVMYLESEASFSRKQETFPEDKKIVERQANGLGLTRPELAIVMSCTKIFITQKILLSDIPDDPFLLSRLHAHFPTLLVALYPDALSGHPLKREIIATHLSNEVINRVGITFLYRLHIETGAEISDILRGYLVVTQIYNMDFLFHSIDILEGKIELHSQYELYHHVRWLYNLSVRWFLKRGRLQGGIASTISLFQRNPIADSPIQIIKRMIRHYMLGSTRDYLEKLQDQFMKYGLKTAIARDLALSRVMYTALNIIELSTQNGFDLRLTAEIYLSAGEFFQLVVFRDKIASDHQEGYRNIMARILLRDELDHIQRTLTLLILKNTPENISSKKAIKIWIKNNNAILKKFQNMMLRITETSSMDYASIFVVLKTVKEMLDFEAR